MTDKLNHGPDCDCGCQEEVPQITLEFDDGENIVCEPLFIFDFEEQDYIALVPVDEDNDEVFLYLYNEFDNGEFEFLDIEDDAQFDRVAKEFERIIEEAEAHG
ncbi:MAG: DUF1292 domain-containing protein [Lachnospiraceae bacterium]|nr:DUF1292 domain-containing protein [Lachnospiraceae bacterium]MDO4733833.1 DUF1292 domain-containing protein [Lachnospiraceae bacterium]